MGEGNGTPLQYSCVENPMDRGAWWAAVYGVAQSRTRLKRLSSSSILPVAKSDAAWRKGNREAISSRFSPAVTRAPPPAYPRNPSGRLGFPGPTQGEG